MDSKWTLIRPGPRGNVLAEGETKGHAHAILERPDIKLYEDHNGGKRLEVLDAPFTVEHEEHNKLTQEPGLYDIGIVREQDHVAEQVRNVAD